MRALAHRSRLLCPVEAALGLQHEDERYDVRLCPLDWTLWLSDAFQALAIYGLFFSHSYFDGRDAYGGRCVSL